MLFLPALVTQDISLEIVVGVALRGHPSVGDHRDNDSLCKDMAN